MTWQSHLSWSHAAALLLALAFIIGGLRAWTLRPKRNHFLPRPDARAERTVYRGGWKV
jgi:hypothetical protein